MKNIIDICKDFGAVIPEDKHSDFLKAVHDEGYITTADRDKAVQRAEKDRDAWKERAETAETTLKGFEGIDPAKIQDELKTWQEKAENAQKEAQKQIYERDFADALKAELEGYKFTSEAAKRDVMSQIKAADLKLKDGKILGLSDLIGQIKTADASAFVDEQAEQLEANRARFTGKMTPNAPSGTMTKKDIMAIKDPSERQAAIANNLGLFGKGDKN